MLGCGRDATNKQKTVKTRVLLAKKHRISVLGVDVVGTKRAGMKQWTQWESPLAKSTSKHQRSNVPRNLGKKRVAAFAIRPLVGMFDSPPTNTLCNMFDSNPSKKRAKSNDGTQTFLDFGQKVFDSRRCCECGMLYAPGVADDEAAHALFCLDHKQRSSLSLGSSLPGSNDICCVESFADGSRSLLFRNSTSISTSNMSSVARRALKRVLDIKQRDVDPDMGFATAESAWSSSSAALCHQRFLLAHVASDGCLAGLVVVERIDTKRHRLHCAEVDTYGVLSPCDEDRELKQALGGVLQIWVSQNSRRRGVARRLLDVARQHICYGIVVPRERLAFSQPTEQGAKFAVAYNDRPGRKISVYQL